MAAHRVLEALREELGAHDVVASLGGGPGSGFARSDPLADGRQPGPALPFLKPVDVVGDAGGAGLDAPVAAVNVLMAQPLLILRRVVQIQLRVFVQRPLVALQRQHVVGRPPQ